MAYNKVMGTRHAHHGVHPYCVQCGDGLSNASCYGPDPQFDLCPNCKAHAERCSDGIPKEHTRINADGIKNPNSRGFGGHI
jgi:hypothetical protein